MKIIITLIIVVIVIILCGLAYISSGLYDVAATKPETQIVKWVLQTTKEKSVRSRSKDITVPSLNNETFIEIGFNNYDQMCVGCHGAPSISPTVIGEGLNPKPPDLSDVAAHMTPAELFWITQNGIKMTGMPAFGPTHSDEELWAMVAFIQKLPDLSPEKYKVLKEESEKMPKEHNHGDHSY